MRVFFLIAVYLVAIAFASPNLYSQTEVIKKQPGNDKRNPVIEIQNKFGGITVNGWDGDAIEANMIFTSSGKTAAAIRTERFAGGEKIVTISTPADTAEKADVNLEIKVPRYTRIQQAITLSGPITISDIKNLAVVNTESGSIQIRGVDAVSVTTVSGRVSIEDIRGNVSVDADKSQSNNNRSIVDIKNIRGNLDVVTGKGRIRAQGIRGQVTLVSIHSSRIEIYCVRGSVEVNDTHSIITLGGIEGGVDLTTSVGEAHFTGEVFPNTRYRMKTLTGVVSMEIPENSGFTASVSTAQGEAISDFALEKDFPSDRSKSNKQLKGSFGDGKSRIELDSFSGSARLSKLVSAETVKCENR